MQPKNISLGRLRGLSQCASPEGTFCILALDHRQAMIKGFSRFGDNAFNESVRFKQDLIRTLSICSSAILLDPVIGAAPSITSRAFPGKTGLIVTVEESGHAGSAQARVSRLPQNWDVGKIKRMGASAVKLLVYHHPQSSTAAAMQDLVGFVNADCLRYDIPLFLEILTYSIHPKDVDFSGAARTEALLKSVEELTCLGGDVLKVEFPADPQADPQVWEDACRGISQASRIPWVLLSAGVDYDVFYEQTQAACAAGASGILAGRAIWKEALSLDGAERQNFIGDTAQARLSKLKEVCDRHARPYFDRYPADEPEPDWQDSYQSI